jgi:methylenetetrahydrofolate reductase (NADPH)
MRVIDSIEQSNGNPVFSFELLPPPKGKGIESLYKSIDLLREFDPKYINITTHHSEYIYQERPDGSFERKTLRRRPGTVAVAAAIQNKYGIAVVPHILCNGFTPEETEYVLIDLQFLGITNLLLLRGDKDKNGMSTQGSYAHATDLEKQINDFNDGVFVDGSKMEIRETPFSFGVACYPEKHNEAPNLDEDIAWLKKKVELGADYAVTQLFYDNTKYFDFIRRVREAGISIPIIPGLKPMRKLSQINVIPRTFNVDLPEALAHEVIRCKTDEEVERIGIEWCTAQCKELIKFGVPGLHFYALGAAQSIREVAQSIF